MQAKPAQRYDMLIAGLRVIIGRQVGGKSQVGAAGAALPGRCVLVRIDMMRDPAKGVTIHLPCLVLGGASCGDKDTCSHHSSHS